MTTLVFGIWFGQIASKVCPFANLYKIAKITRNYINEYLRNK